jgi:hypothetical protein
VKAAERFFAGGITGRRIASGRFLSTFSWRRINGSRLVGPGWARKMIATTAAASVFAAWFASVFPFMAAASRVAATAAFALAAGDVLFVLMADAVAGCKGDFKLVQLVPLFLGALVVGDRQQGLHAATRIRGVLFGHGGIIPLAERVEHKAQHAF